MISFQSKLYIRGVEEDVYKIALNQMQRLGIVKTKTLVAYAGGPKAFFDLSDKELSDCSGAPLIHIKKYKRKAALDRADEELKFMQENGINYHYYQDNNYPSALKFCDDGPMLIFSKGNIRFDQINVAIVGTRKCTSYGKKLTHQLIQDLRPHRVQIISGLAHGIDKEAHEAALDNELSTIAVLGHGMDLIYPAAHRKLAERMLENGGLITEFMSRTPGDPSHFPRRNRIVAGISDATIVMESAASGGSLITANMANGYNREVFAFPGNVDRSSSEGCNNLIKQNKAHLATSAGDIASIMEWEEAKHDTLSQIDIFEAMTIDETKLVNIIRQENENIHVDTLGKAAKMNGTELSLHLFNLEMRGVIQSLPGKMYRLEKT